MSFGREVGQRPRSAARRLTSGRMNGTSRQSGSRQQIAERRRQARQVRFDHAPDDAMVDVGIAVDQHVAEGDDARELGDRCSGDGVDAAQRGERFADDLELPLDGAAQQIIRLQRRLRALQRGLRFEPGVRRRVELALRDRLLVEQPARASAPSRSARDAPAPMRRRPRRARPRPRTASVDQHQRLALVDQCAGGAVDRFDRAAHANATAAIARVSRCAVKRGRRVGIEGAMCCSCSASRRGTRRAVFQAMRSSVEARARVVGAPGSVAITSARASNRPWHTPAQRAAPRPCHSLPC